MVRTHGVAVMALIGALCGCGDLPRDPEKTLIRVQSAKIIRLGMVAGAPQDAAAQATLASLAQSTGARIVRSEGHAEELLEGLEEGEFDIVFGQFADDSPWATHVHLGTPPAGPDKPPKSHRVARFAFRNGENAWIKTVEEAAR